MRKEKIVREGNSRKFNLYRTRRRLALRRNSEGMAGRGLTFRSAFGVAFPL
ncbi:MAG: hypothetical protein LBF89_11975 [Bacteroidales bacterium]|jgi:hypothetical protein|nr:hypothetical protein [Bacteroidales bacterium]